MFASSLGQTGRSICLPSSSVPSRISSGQRVPSVRVSAFTAESEPASFMPSSTYANLPKARVKRRVPLPDFPLADKATRHFVQAQVARSSASEETGPSGSETAPPVSRMRLSNGAIVLLPPGFTSMKLDAYASARLKSYKTAKAESSAPAAASVQAPVAAPSTSSEPIPVVEPLAASPSSHPISQTVSTISSAESTLCSGMKSLAKVAAAVVSPTATAARQAFRYASVKVKATTRSVSLANVLEAANSMDSQH